MKNSHFTNSTGLPDPNLHHGARPVAAGLGADPRFPEEYRKYYSMRSSATTTSPSRTATACSSSTHGRRRQNRPHRSRRLLPDLFRPARQAPPALRRARHRFRQCPRQRIAKLINWGFISYDTIAVFAKDQEVAKLPRLEGRLRARSRPVPRANCISRTQGLCRQGEIRIRRRAAPDRTGSKSARSWVSSRSASRTNPTANTR